MRKVLSTVAVLMTALTLTACSTTEKTASVGAVTGAVIGGATTGTVGGALVGATVGGITGAVAGELIGRYRDDPTKCVWEDRNGRRYLAPCSPNG
jgi:phage tail tape-measure protein